MDPILRYAAAIIVGVATLMVVGRLFGLVVWMLGVDQSEPGLGTAALGLACIAALVAWYAALRGLRMLDKPQR